MNHDAKIYPASKRKSRAGCLRVVVILIVILSVLSVLGGCALGYIRLPFLEKQASEAHTFSLPDQAHLTGTVTLNVDNSVGYVHIHGSANTNQIVVQATKTTFGFLVDPGAAHIDYSQSNDKRTETISKDLGSSWSDGYTTVDLDISVPLSLNLNVSDDAGKIEIDDVAGSVNVSANASEIQLTHVTLQGNSTIESSAGAIDFTGTFDPASHTEMRADAGAITIGLLGNNPMYIDAGVNTGSISSTIPGLAINRFAASAEAHGEIGRGSTTNNALLSLQANAGDIKIYEP